MIRPFTHLAHVKRPNVEVSLFDCFYQHDDQLAVNDPASGGPVLVALQLQGEILMISVNLSTKVRDFLFPSCEEQLNSGVERFFLPREASCHSYWVIRFSILLLYQQDNSFSCTLFFFKLIWVMIFITWVSSFFQKSLNNTRAVQVEIAKLKACLLVLRGCLNWRRLRIVSLALVFYTLGQFDYLEKSVLGADKKKQSESYPSFLLQVGHHGDCTDIVLPDHAPEVDDGHRDRTCAIQSSTMKFRYFIINLI